MKSTNDRHVLLWVANYIILACYGMSLSLYLYLGCPVLWGYLDYPALRMYLDYPVLQTICISCGCYLAMSLVVYVFYKRVTHLLLTTLVFILHALFAG